MAETPEQHRIRGQIYYQAHKEQILEKNRVWRRANYPRSLELARKSNRKSGRAAHLKWRYDLTMEQFDQMAASQDGRCAICRRENVSLHVDHDHQTELIRGLLCGRCNRGLGMFIDRVDHLENAIAYLKRYLAAVE